MRFRIHWSTEYRYDGPVVDQHNTVRVKPASTPTQTVEEFRFTVDPTARLESHVDYFGTEVINFNIPSEHERLAIDAHALVSTAVPAIPDDAGWGQVEADSYRESAGEYVIPAEDEPQNGNLAELRDAARGESPLDTLRKVCALIPDRFDYRQGVTFVGSTVDDLLEKGAGVCQDFVHLSLILLRSHGIGARYVSGYLFAASDKGDDSAEVDTHAWVEALVPDGDGGLVWVGADPTNHLMADENYVKIGHGRHYGDVAPIRGVYRGGAEASMEAGVVMTKLDT